MPKPKYMAHSSGGESSSQWQPLPDHARNVALLTGEHLRYVSPQVAHLEEYAQVAGLLHDLGKYRDAFQTRRLGWHPHEQREAPELRGGRCQHSDAGARVAQELLGMGRTENAELPFAIAAHHGALGNVSVLLERLNKTEVSEVEELCTRALADTPELGPLLERLSKQSLPLAGTERAFLIRTLFSALVDADRLDTEAHGSPDKAELRTRWRSDEARMGQLLERVEAKMRELAAKDAEEPKPINALRREMYHAALEQAETQTGFFRLTMPTGGGKTLTSLAFALAHAQAHGLRRVVYGVPFTSIIDQTAEVFREVLEGETGEFCVLEHHSNLEPRHPKSAGEEELITAAELATENWEAPVIVTTTVRLFQETLFGTRTGQLRRLHNLSGSVIVLDEAQTLPAPLLQPTLDALQFLVKYCGCSVVLCTATQPALDESLGFPSLAHVRDLVPNAAHYFGRLERVEYETRLDTPMTAAEVAAELAELPQALCIVNTKAAAKEVFEALESCTDDGPEANYHLSTDMCPVHRKRTIAIIRARLLDKTKPPCRVVSTQLIEAGIDVDFPHVYRSMGPLEAIVQAAGRCNREGKLEGKGRVVVFVLEGESVPRGDYKIRRNFAAEALKKDVDLNSPDAFQPYFRQVYSHVEQDPKLRVDGSDVKLQQVHADLSFDAVAAAYRIIDDNTVPLLIRGYDSERVNELLRTIQYPPKEDTRKAVRAAWRELQGYTVNVYAHQADKLAGKKLLAQVPELMERARRLGTEPPHIYEWPTTVCYDDKLGLVPERDMAVMTTQF